jgi:hypothetical protein
MWCPNDDWYETIFDDCKSKAEVVEKATEMVRNRDKQAYDRFHQTIDMLRGHKSSLEFIDEMSY